MFNIFGIERQMEGQILLCYSHVSLLFFCKMFACIILVSPGTLDAKMLALPYMFMYLFQWKKPLILESAWNQS